MMATCLSPFSFIKYLSITKDLVDARLSAVGKLLVVSKF